MVTKTSNMYRRLLTGVVVSIVCCSALERSYASSPSDLQKKIDADVAILAGSNPDAATDAARELATFGEPAIPAVTPLLQSPSPKTRDEAALVLGWMVWNGHPATTSAGALVAAMDDTNEQVKIDVDDALATLGSAAQPALGNLTKQLSSPDKDLQSEAIRVLGFLGSGASPAVPALIHISSDADADTRESVAMALGEIGVASGQVAETLVMAAHDSVPNVRDRALIALQCEDYRSPKVKDTLLAALQDSDWTIRLDAERTLGLIKPSATDSIPDILPLTRDNQALVRSYAVDALVNMQAPKAVLLPALIDALKDPKDENRDSAARHIGDIGPAAADTTAALFDAIGDMYQRSEVAYGNDMGDAINKIGPWPVSALPEIIKALELKSDAQFVASDVLLKMGAAAVPALAVALEDPSDANRLCVLEVLTEMGTSATAAAPSLVTLLDSNSDRVSTASMYALCSIGSSAIPALAAGMHDPNTNIRDKSAKTISWIATAALQQNAAWKQQHAEKLGQYFGDAVRSIEAMPPTDQKALQQSLWVIGFAAKSFDHQVQQGSPVHAQ